jgi:hypothetical protein
VVVVGMVLKSQGLVDITVRTRRSARDQLQDAPS